MAQEVLTIQNLIIAAANGASAGVVNLQNAGLPIELDEFEIEVTYASENEITKNTQGSAELKFTPFKASFGKTRSSRNNVTYGLKVRFLFSGKEQVPPATP